MNLQKQKDTSAHKYLVFTSAGDNSFAHMWKGGQSFDIFIYNYSDTINQALLEVSDYFLHHKGGKFHNLKHAYDNFREVFDRYEQIWIPDDDLIISGKHIDELFETHVKYGFKISQPSQHPSSQITYPALITQGFSEYRCVSVAEISMPLFEKVHLDEFMQLYDGVINCYGLDWWYSAFTKNKYGDGYIAVIDRLNVINPFPIDKAGKREIDAFQNEAERIRIWQKSAKQHGLVELEVFEISRHNSYKPLVLLRYVKCRIERALRPFSNRIKMLKRSLQRL